MDEYRPHPGVAAILSFAFTGLGQIYNGEIKKGLWLIFLTGFGIMLVMLGAIFIWQALVNFFLAGFFVAGFILFLVGVILICVLGAYSISDAFGYARSKN